MLDVKHININKEPIPHLVINHPIPVNDYNRLYELWNKPDHETWKTLCEKHNVKINFKANLKQMHTEIKMNMWAIGFSETDQISDLFILNLEPSM